MRLVVDDEDKPTDRRSSFRKISRSSTPDSRAALHQIREHQPDIVLTDLMMPGLDGMGLLKAARSWMATSNVMMTAYGCIGRPCS